MKRFFVILFFLLPSIFLEAQQQQQHFGLGKKASSIKKILFSTDSSQIVGFDYYSEKNNEAEQITINPISFLTDSIVLLKNSKPSSALLNQQFIKQTHVKQIILNCTPSFDGIKVNVKFTNISEDTISIQNVVPFELNDENVYITGKGNHSLSRTHIFLPGKKPVNVIVPDNAWELGFNTLLLKKAHQWIYGLSRRDKSTITLGVSRRFETVLFPKGSVEYTIWIEPFNQNEKDGENGLLKVFQQRKLYDLATFNDTLYNRTDLQWIRHSYVMHLMMSWDKFFYDPLLKKYKVVDFVKRGQQLYGGDDIISIWPTWPTLGLDQRNQFDLFNDLPGSLKAIKKLSNDLTKLNKHLFVSYNPWDVDTRQMNHYTGLSWLIQNTSADGVVLDTQGSSSDALQYAADSVRKGVIMYSEGMAVPKDMPGIISGRVHNALYYPPLLNLNKLIQPGFTIFRVAELYKEPINREFATSFFNGYGTEINIMAPGQPEWVKSQYALLGKTTRLLRQLSDNFNTPNPITLYHTFSDDIWVNAWPAKEKTVYTIFSLKPEGYKDSLFAVQPKEGWHFVDVYHHKMLTPTLNNGMYFIEAETDAFHKKYLGTNNEGAVDCIIHTPIVLDAMVKHNKLHVNLLSNAVRISNTQNDLSAKNSSIINDQNSYIQIWETEPSYTEKPVILKSSNQIISIEKWFGRFEGKLVIQLMTSKEGRETLIDEVVVELPSGASRITNDELMNIHDSASHNSTLSRPVSINNFNRKVSLSNMVQVPSGQFTFKQTHGDDFIPYPIFSDTNKIKMDSYWMDIYPVTNSDFYNFMKSSHYKPSDTHHFLKHWVNNKPTISDLNKPVVYISYEDAKAYATFYGKLLPTEIEWQYAAQTAAMNEWPWKQEKPVTRTFEEVTTTLSVIKINGIDSSFCNLGNGVLDPVGTYPKGKNALGVSDLVGSVWQLTKDIYTSGSYKYIIMKGGSYFKPSGSWWYVQAGPRELTYAQYLLRVSPGFERNGTVGFRCVYHPTYQSY